MQHSGLESLGQFEVLGAFAFYIYIYMLSVYDPNPLSSLMTLYIRVSNMTKDINCCHVAVDSRRMDSVQARASSKGWQTRGFD